MLCPYFKRFWPTVKNQTKGKQSYKAQRAIMMKDLKWSKKGKKNFIKNNKINNAPWQTRKITLNKDESKLNQYANQPNKEALYTDLEWIQWRAQPASPALWSWMWKGRSSAA